MSVAYSRAVSNTHPIVTVIDSLPDGERSQEALAAKLDVTQSLISQWISGVTAIHVRHYPNIVKVAKGRVTETQLLEYELNRLKSKGRRKAS
jgi:transcriptional regulator with XRE-family HTH domain